MGEVMEKIWEIKIIKQFIKYFGVGLLAAVVNITSLYILSSIFLINYLLANIISFILGLIINYLLSKKYVFKDKSLNKILEFIIYGVIGVIGLGIDTLCLWLFTEKVNFYYMISKIISTGITFIWNFLARKLLYYVIERCGNK